MSEDRQPVLRVASARAKFFLEWGRESLKGIVPALNEVLGKLLTLDTALIGAGVVAAKEGFVPFCYAVTAVGLLILSLAASLWGLYPVGREINFNSPEDIAAAEWSAARRKKKSLDVAFGTLVLALSIALFGVWTAGPSKPPAPPAVSTPS